MSYTHIVHPIEPIIDDSTNILILGSFPSVKSRIEEFYYANKFNRFWEVLSIYLNVDLCSLNNKEKRKVLLEHHIGLYGVVYECDIDKSKDDTIKNVVYSDILSLIKGKNITHFILNGKKAYDLFTNKYPTLIGISYYLPSTSSANAKYSVDDLSKIFTGFVGGKNEI